MRDFSLVVDQPPSFGGADVGPDPTEHLLASLGGCVNVVIHMITQQLGVKICVLHLTIEGELDPSRLMG